MFTAPFYPLPLSLSMTKINRSGADQQKRPIISIFQQPNSSNACRLLFDLSVG
jgi:hypothetical protein